MTVQITIRDVPKEVRDVLAARAALEHRSMQEFLRCELERIASRPTIETWMHAIRERKSVANSKVSIRQILDSRDSERR